MQIEDRGREDFLTAWNEAVEHGIDFHAVDAAHMLGIISEGEVALEWNLKAMQFAEDSQDAKTKSWLGSLYNNIGWTMHGLGRFDQALECFLNNETWYRERLRHEEALIAHWSMSKMLRLLNRTDEALRELYVIADERKQRSLPNDGYLVEEIGECLLAKGHLEQAQPFFASAYAILSQDDWLLRNEASRIERLKMLGKC
jgi:tetratricopeptide (TPR) repeat protein